MQTSTGPSAADGSFGYGRDAYGGVTGSERGDPRTGPPPLLDANQLAKQPASAAHRRALEQAADRITEWVPKGVHFGWERSFKNKGKFPATMSKDAARSLVAGLLRNAPLTISPSRRPDRTSAEQLRVVAEAGETVGTRGQRRVRIVLGRDSAGFFVENAFPVRVR